MDIGAVLAGLAVVVVVFGLAGCAGGSVDPPNADVMASRSASTARAAGQAGEVGRHLDAAAVLRKLREAGLPMAGGVVQTAASDPNKLLGRPDGYSSRASFDLPGGDVDGAPGDVGRGGVIEVWSDGVAARGRADYIQGILRQAPQLGTEYELLSGTVLVRITGRVDPAVVDRFRPVVDTLEP